MNATTQRATITGNKSNGRNMSVEKETVHTLELIACHKGRPVSIAIARFYMSRWGDGASPLYCSVWTHSGPWISGRGSARGYGYHKKSAALQAALDSAGIKLALPIDGRGDGAMSEAMIAVGVALGYKADAMMVATA